MHPSALVRAATLFSLLAGAAPLGAFEPRPLSAAERGAVEIALAFAARGPEAVAERLAADAPLAALDRGAAAAEIAARLGPREGASWTLETPSLDLGPGAALFTIDYPSGIDDRLRLELVEAADGWRVRNLWTLADRPPRPAQPLRAAAPAEQNEAAPVRRAPLLAAALAIAALATAGRAARHPVLRATGAALAVALLMAACRGGGEGEGDSAGPPAFAQPRLGPLAPLRLALAGGAPLAATAGPAEGDAPAEVERVAELWQAQARLVAGDLAAADARLGLGPREEDPPLAALLGARVAALRLRGRVAAERYDEVARAGFDGDGLRLEALGVALVAEEEGEASALPLLAAGSRRAEAWYQAAAEALANDQSELAAEALRIGWHLSPLPRDELFAEPALAALAARPELFPLFELGSPREPRVEPTGERRPVALPALADGRLCGGRFTVELDGFELDLPGGAGLAGAGAPVEDAAARRRRAEERALATIAPAAPGIAASPRRLRVAETAARALARDGRWQELLEVTAPWTARDGAPELLLRFHALALDRLGRGGEAKSALAALATRQLGARRPAPGTLYDLAELVADEGQYDTAIRLIRKADAQLGRPHGERRLRQLELSRELAATARELRSRHFVVRYPAATGERYAGQLATVLEEERRRMLAWIPEPGATPVEVELFPLEQFLSAYGGDIEVVGVYDGRLRMPLADLRSLDPRLVAVVSHELAHALLSGATREQAPRWFQEGLAQHLEMGSLAVNPLPELEASGRTLAFPALEPILDGFAEPQLVELAYAESAWAVAYVESRWGVEGIRRLVREFAAAASTERAIAALGGGDLDRFDRAFRSWGAERAPASRRREARRFDRELDRPFDAETAEAKAGRAAVSDLTLGTRQEPRAAGAPDPAAMRAWHARYREASAAVRAAYAPIARTLGAAAGQPAREECAALEREVSALLGARAEALGAPDLEVANRLRAAYERMGELGASCAAGRGVEAVGLYPQVGAALARAAAALAPYGLQP